jgi:thiol:disulfide interchange protein
VTKFHYTAAVSGLFHFLRNKAGLRSRLWVVAAGWAALAWVNNAHSQLASTSPAKGPVKVDAVEVELVAKRQGLEPGKAAWLGLRIRHDPHWHTYWRNPGDSGLPTTLAWSVPAQWQAGPIVWPAPKRLPVGPLVNYGFEDEIVLPVQVQVPADATGQSSLSVKADWLMCKDVCIPGQANLSIELPVDRVQADSPGRYESLFEAALASSGQHQPNKLQVRFSMQADASASAKEPAKATLIMPAAQSVSQAQFFPYEENWMQNAGLQVLQKGRLQEGSDTAAVYAHSLALVADQKPEQIRQQLFSSANKPVALGVMVLDGVPQEVMAMQSPATVLADLQVVYSLAATTLNSANPPSVVTPSGSSIGLGLALMFALAGGLVLNLMPCVFPVLGLKVLSFAQHNQAHVKRNAWLFTLGVLLGFWLLATGLLALQQAGQAAGWGFQMQSPVFVGAMAVLFVLIALNLFGLFEIGTSATRLAQVEQGLASKGQGGLAAFASGGLAVLVATPCTAPLMGPAMGYTLGQPPHEVLLVFTALGLGLALPYLVLGLIPAWIKWLPKPGAWMQTLRQLLAFPMLLTVVWLLWVLNQQTSADVAAGFSAMLILLALLIWLWQRVGQRTLRFVAVAFSFSGLVLVGNQTLLAAMSIQGQPRAKAGTQWAAWSAQAVDTALANKRAVFVDFTAAWCVSCQVNKKLVLNTAAVQEAFAARNMVLMQADWTSRDDQITKELARYGRNGVPLYLVFLPGEPQPRVLPELLTASIVLQALPSISLASKTP